MADSDWKNARQWIISTGVDSMDNKSIQYSEELLDFAESLRDGVIICDIANMMKRDCIQYRRKVNNIAQHEYLCKRNIDLFLRACVEIFHIDSKNLFNASDLYHVTDFKAVVRTLSVLSHKPEATTIRRWTPFSVGSEKKKKKRSVVEEEDPYGVLPDIIDERAPPYINTAPPDENIYDEVEKTYSSSTYDTLIHYNKVPITNDDNKLLTKRDHIVNEILQTEEGYMKNLKTMVENYITPLKSHISSEDKETIFMNTEKIYSFHLLFNRELGCKKQFNSTTDDKDLRKMDAGAFVRCKSQFLMYSYYITHLDEAQKRVVDLLKSSGFRNMIEEINKKLDRKFPLQEQLAVCFQRVLRYPLLLRDLKKNTPEENEEYVEVHDALEAMEDVAKYINEFKRDVENMDSINQIKSSLKFDMPTFGRSKDYGRHLKDGELQVQFADSDKKEKRFAFLFEHTLLLCKNKGDTNDVKEVLDLAKYTLEDSPALGRGNYSYCLSLKARQQDGVSEKKNCKLLAKTQQLKIYWISSLTECIKKVTLSDYEGQLDRHQFTLQTFDTNNADCCGICKKLLLGQISQGYLCLNRGCQLFSHTDCLLECPPCEQSCPSPKPAKLGLGKSVSQVVKKKVRPPRNERAKTLDSNVPANISLMNKRVSLHKQKSLDTYSWFAGILSRDQASELLKDSINGSFLIRESEKGGLAISIQYNNNSFHIKITEKDDHVYLTDAKQFPSVDELISYYKSNSLGASFPTVPSKLSQIIRKPVKKNMVVIYNWDAKSTKELSLKIGQIVSIIQDEGNWWLGVCDGKQGYFPKNYVK